MTRQLTRLPGQTEETLRMLFREHHGGRLQDVDLLRWDICVMLQSAEMSKARCEAILAQFDALVSAGRLYCEERGL